MDKRTALFALLLFGSAISLGCTTAQCRTIPPLTERVLSVWHGSGGPAPIVSSLVISSQGQVLYEPPRGKRLCGQLTEPELASVRELIARGALRQSAIEAQSEGTGYSDYEEIEIHVGPWSAAIPMELTPPQVRELLLRIDSIIQDRFGKRAPWMDSLDDVRARVPP